MYQNSYANVEPGDTLDGWKREITVSDLSEIGLQLILLLYSRANYKPIKTNRSLNLINHEDSRSIYDPAYRFVNFPT